MAKNWNLHQLLSFGGSIAGGDQWSSSLKTGYGDEWMGQISKGDQDTALYEIAPLVSTFFSKVANSHGIVSAFKLEWCKYNAIGHDGKYFFAETSQFDYSPAVVGPVAVGQSVRESLVVTLNAGPARGRGRYGRFYPPAMSYDPEAGSAYISAANATTKAAHAKELIDGINAISDLDGPINVVNTSPGDSVRGTAPVTRQVTWVQIDRVPDTQRRRTNRIPRQYVEAQIVN